MPSHIMEALLRERLQALSLEQKVRLLTGKDVWALHEMPEIGLHSLVTSDGPGGVRGTVWDERDPSLNVPSATALATTWDDELVAAAGRLIGADARKKGVHVLLAPTIGLHRSPLGGRNFEAWSEDAYLTGRLAAAFVRGVQSQGVGATAKHFVLNDSETERRTYSAEVDEDVLRELYLRPFEDVVREGVWLIMAAYNRHDGILLTEHRGLTWDVLKQEWGFDGVVVSDWHAVRSTVASARSGTDLEMPAHVEQQWGDGLVDAVHSGLVDESTIDDKVLRVLRLAARTGALEGAGGVLPEPASLADADSQLREIAAHSMVLLRNTGVLPLSSEEGEGERQRAGGRGSAGSVAVIGELADHVSTQGGGSAHVEPVYVVQPLDALRACFGDRLVYERGPALSRTLWPLPLGLTNDPVEGGPGFHLEAFGASDLLRAEHREAATFVFAGTLPAGTTRTRWTTDLCVASSGAHQIAVTGRGRFRILVNDAEIGRFEHTAALDDDVQAIVHPPESRAEVVLEAGVAASLVIETEPLFAAGGQLWRFGVGYRAPQPNDDEMLRRAVDAARGADAAVVIVGATDDHEVEGLDRADLRLPGRQDELVSAIAAANPHTIVVVNAGSVYTMPWADEVAAILWAGMPGQEAGHALTDVLTGAHEPWGRLTTTVPPDGGDAPIPSTKPVDGILAYHEGRGVGYRGYEAARATPLFAFGHGLGYTTWSYEAAVLADDASALTVTVRNTGTRAGREVVQVYYRPPGATIRLVGFASAVAEPGQHVTVTVDLDARAASRWDVDAHGWVPLIGGELRIGRSVTDAAITLPVDRPVGRHQS